MAEHVSRKITNKILETIEEGGLDRDTVILACLKYMSEADVADMAHANEFFETCAECAALDGEHEDGCKLADDAEED